MPKNKRRPAIVFPNKAILATI